MKDKPQKPRIGRRAEYWTVRRPCDGEVMGNYGESTAKRKQALCMKRQTVDDIPCPLMRKVSCEMAKKEGIRRDTSDDVTMKDKPMRPKLVRMLEYWTSDRYTIRRPCDGKEIRNCVGSTARRKQKLCLKRQEGVDIPCPLNRKVSCEVAKKEGMK